MFLHEEIQTAPERTIPMPIPSPKSCPEEGIYMLVGCPSLFVDELAEIRKEHPHQPIHTDKFEGPEHRFMIVIANPDPEGNVAALSVRKKGL